MAHRVAFYEEYARADAPDKVNHFGEELLGPRSSPTALPHSSSASCRTSSMSPSCGVRATRSRARAAISPTCRPSAVRDGDEWVINGQKVWTSLAHWAQWCFVVARTEKGSKRHAGLSYLLVPLDQPGVEIRPIVQLTGDSEFNEVFFTDARTDASLVVGVPGDGWRVAMGTLTFERGVSTLGQQIRYARELSGIVALAKTTGAVDDPIIRERLIRSWRVCGPCGPTRWRRWTPEQPGQDSVSKLLWVNWHRSLGELAMDIRAEPVCTRRTASSTNGSGCSCSRVPTPSTAARTRFSATSSPSGCSAYPER